MKWKLVCKRSFLFLNSQLTKTDSQHRFDPAVVLSLLSCSPPTGWWPKSKHSPRLSKKKMPLPVWGCPTPTHCLRDAIAPSSMPWSLQGPVIYRSYHHTAGALRNIWWDVFSLACHFTLPRSYSYFFDLTTFCIWYLRHNLSVFDTEWRFFLCKFLLICPFVSDVAQLLFLGFGLCCKVCVATSIDRG